jgi:hypothetical protein
VLFNSAFKTELAENFMAVDAGTATGAPFALMLVLVSGTESVRVHDWFKASTVWPQVLDTTVTGPWGLV